MIDLLLIRHGETTWNAEGRIQGQADSPLSLQGIREADALARRLSETPLAALVTSDLQRAYRTAAAVNRFHGLPVRTHPGLREVCLGRWEGRTITELTASPEDAPLLAAWKADAATNRPPGGERLEDLQERTAAALEQILHEVGEGTAAVVTHAGVIRAAVAWILGVGLREMRRLSIRNASITQIRWEAQRPSLRSLSDTAHLEDRKGG